MLKPLLQPNPNHSIDVIRALKKILRPLVNFFISSGITYPVLSELLKEIYVEVAENEFKLSNKKQTDSRIHFITGVHRKDVKRLRNQAIPEIEYSTSSLSALLISRWLGDPNFSDENGPRPLPRLAKQGGNNSFESLVVSVNKDIRSRAILDEWLNMNIVTLDEDNFVHLNQAAFIPQQGDEEKAWFFGENLHDHIAASVHNMKNEQPPLLERAVYYDELSESSVEELMELSEKTGMETLIKINNKALELQKNDKNKTNNRHRIRLGVYFFHNKEDNSDKSS